jgi:hypothetical protein
VDVSTDVVGGVCAFCAPLWRKAAKSSDPRIMAAPRTANVTPLDAAVSLKLTPFAVTVASVG